MASSIVGLTDLSISLIDAGNRLLKPPPSSTDELLALLNVRLLLFYSFNQNRVFLPLLGWVLRNAIRVFSSLPLREPRMLISSHCLVKSWTFFVLKAKPFPL